MYLSSIYPSSYQILLEFDRNCITLYINSCITDMFAILQSMNMVCPALCDAAPSSDHTAARLSPHPHTH